MKIALASIVVFLSLSLTQLVAQEELYFVSVPTSYIRSGPKEIFSKIHELNKGDQIQLIDDSYGEWWAIQFGTTNGFMKSSDLIAISAPPVKIVYQEKEESNNLVVEDEYEQWDETNYETGDAPLCLNTIPEYDHKLDNHLLIKNEGSKTEAVVKLIRVDTSDRIETTYRVAFIKAGDNFNMINIPKGKYFLKIAYGQEWKSTSVDNECVSRFTKNAQYEKGGDIIDFTPIQTSRGVELPSYELSLDVEHNVGNGLSTKDISEDEFND